MPMIDQFRGDIARLKRDEAALIKKRSSDQAEAAKAVADSRAKRDQASRTSSMMMTQSYLQAAERLDKRAVEYERKVADTTTKLADNSKKQADKSRALEAALRNAQRQQDQEAERRRQLERRHTQEIARLSRPTVHYVHEVRTIEPPKPERLRVLYLAANPEMDLRVDAEVRKVKEAVKKALHRDLIDIDHRPAATPEDLLDGLNELRPHIVHFSGHGGNAAVLFDDGEVVDPQGRDVSFSVLRRALGATDRSPTLLLLNACDTLDGAEVILVFDTLVWPTSIIGNGPPVIASAVTTLQEVSRWGRWDAAEEGYGGAVRGDPTGV